MKKNKTVEYGKYGLLFLIPFFLVFLVFQLYPLLYTFYNSFIYSAKNGRYVTETVGLGNFTNYVFAKTGSEFWQSLIDRKSTRLNSSHPLSSRMPSSA